MAYLFHIDDGSTISILHPLNFNESNIGWAVEQGQIFKRRKLNGSLRFENNVKLTYYDFDYFYNKLLAGVCDNLVLTIYKDCDGWEEIYTGRTTPRKGNYDVDRCGVDFDFESFDKYSCILDNWETEYNALTLAPETVGMTPESQEDYFYADFTFDNSVYGYFDPLNYPLRVNAGTILNLRFDQMDIDLLYNTTPNAQTANVGHPWQQTYYDNDTGQNKMYTAGAGGHVEGWQAEIVSWVRIGNNVVGPEIVHCRVRYVRIKIVTLDINGVPQPPPGTNVFT